MDMKALGSPMPQKDWSPAREKCRARPCWPVTSATTASAKSAASSVAWKTVKSVAPRAPVESTLRCRTPCRSSSRHAWSAYHAEPA